MATSSLSAGSRRGWRYLKPVSRVRTGMARGLASRSPREGVRRTVGGLALTVGVVLATEIIGVVVTPSYAAQARTGGVNWPPVEVFDVAWIPSSPLTLGLIIVLVASGCLLLRDTLPFAKARTSELMSGLKLKEEDRA